MPLDDIAPEPNPPLTPERVERMRRMYAEGFTVSRILAHCATSLGTLYACLDGQPFGLDGPRWPPLPRRRVVVGKRRRALKGDAASLTNRLVRTAERHARDIELRLNAGTLDGPERERDVRMLATLTRSLRDLERMRETGDGAPARGAPDAADGFSHDDLERLRADLLLRLDAAAETADGE